MKGNRIPLYTEKTSVGLTPYQRKKLEELAGKRGVAVGDLIRYFVDLGLDELIKTKKNK